MGGVITAAEAKALILRKHHDLVTDQLERYLGAERRRLVQVFDALWSKYSVSYLTLDGDRNALWGRLRSAVGELGYL